MPILSNEPAAVTARTLRSAAPRGAHRYDEAAWVLRMLTGSGSGVVSLWKKKEKKNKKIAVIHAALLISVYSGRCRSETFTICKKNEMGQKKEPARFGEYRNSQTTHEVPLLF